MISTETTVHRCPHCGGERLQKNGHAENKAQRAKCVDCQRTFILEPKGPRYDEKFKDQVPSAYQDKMSIRGLKRTFGVCYQTVVKWVGEKSGRPSHLRGHAPARQKRRRARTR